MTVFLLIHKNAQDARTGVLATPRSQDRGHALPTFFNGLLNGKELILERRSNV